MNFSRLTAIATAAVLLCAQSAVAAKKPKPDFQIKFATLAPDGSTWMKTMHKIDDEVRARTENRVGFKFYPGGVQGDGEGCAEKDSQQTTCTQVDLPVSVLARSLLRCACRSCPFCLKRTQNSIIYAKKWAMCLSMRSRRKASSISDGPTSVSCTSFPNRRSPRRLISAQQRCGYGQEIPSLSCSSARSTYRPYHSRLRTC